MPSHIVHQSCIMIESVQTKPVIGECEAIKHVSSISAELSTADILAHCSLQAFSRTALNMT